VLLLLFVVLIDDDRLAGGLLHGQLAGLCGESALALLLEVVLGCTALVPGNIGHILRLSKKRGITLANRCISSVVVMTLTLTLGDHPRTLFLIAILPQLLFCQFLLLSLLLVDWLLQF